MQEILGTLNHLAGEMPFLFVTWGYWSQTITGFVRVIENLESHGFKKNGKGHVKSWNLKNLKEYEP